MPRLECHRCSSPQHERVGKERTQDRITSLSVQLIRFVNCVVHLNGRTLRSRETRGSADSNEFYLKISIEK